MTRAAFDPVAIARDAELHGLVVLVGAGLSMGPPSSLPGWSAINDAFLENLALRLAEHTDGEVGNDVAEFVADRRETSDVAQPDLQAQLAEESLGEHYFALFEPLDIDAWNEGHAAVAALARTGKLRAVVTTNFDRLIELALEASGVKVAVFCDADGFDRLSRHLADPAANPIDGLPVIKVHGSVGQRSTMVDTLRQRVLGRPEALESSLKRLYRQHAVIVAGFSGADLSYDPQYLGLRKGALQSPSFNIVVRSGSEPRRELAELASDGNPRARVIDGALPGSLLELAKVLGHDGRLPQPKWDPEMESPGIRKAMLPSAVHSSWAKTLSPVQAAVVLALIAEAAGSTDAAARLLQRAMPHHLKADLASDPAMSQHLGMIARHLIEAGHIAADTSEGWFKGGVSALDVLSVKGARLTTESLALLSLALALRGVPIQSDAAGMRALRESREDFRPTVRADTVCALARCWAVAEKWGDAYVQCLREAYDLMRDWGDEPRKARVGALLCRFLIQSGDLDAARAVLAESMDVVRRLNLAVVGNELLAAKGRLHLAEGRPDQALRPLMSACEHFQASQHLLRLAETLLPLSEAAFAARDVETYRRCRASFESLLPLMPGMALPDAATRARVSCSVGAFEEAGSVVADLREFGQRFDGHPWVPPLADRLDAFIGRTAGEHASRS
jgi:SIR2-like domain